MGSVYYTDRVHGDTEYVVRLRVDHDKSRRRLSLLGVELIATRPSNGP